MTKIRINLRSVAFMTACLAVSMMLLTSCKKDSGTSDDNGGSEPGDNPFVGTWVGEDNDKITLDFTAKAWELNANGTDYGSGTYTYKGNNATLTVTDAGASDAEVGEQGTAKVSGKTLTLIFDDTMTFTKKSGGGGGGGGGGDDPDGYVIEATGIEWSEESIATVKALFENDNIVASAPYGNAAFKLTLPNDGSGAAGEVNPIMIYAYDSKGNETGLFICDTDDMSYSLSYVYVTKDMHYTYQEEYDVNGAHVTSIYDCNYKKGWNIDYVKQESNGNNSTFTTTTQKPANVKFIWYYMGWMK